MIEPRELSMLGNVPLPEKVQFAVFCSVKCPASILLKTHDLAQRLKEQSISVVSGFHSPAEQEMLTVLLRGTGLIVLCPARSITDWRVPSVYKPHLENGRMLVVSPFEAKQNRITAKTAQVRNQLVAALADRVFVAYAAPGGKTEVFCREILSQGKLLLTFDSEYTENLRTLGAQVLPPDLR